MVYPFHLDGHMLYECYNSLQLEIQDTLSSDDLRFLLLCEVTENKRLLLLHSSILSNVTIRDAYPLKRGP